jgi:hypothetical protein
VFRETNSSVAGVRQLGKPEVSGRRDAAEREHLHSGVSMAAARQRTTRAAKSPCYQVDSRGLNIAKCEDAGRQPDWDRTQALKKCPVT